MRSPPRSRKIIIVLQSLVTTPSSCRSHTVPPAVVPCVAPRPRLTACLEQRITESRLTVVGGVSGAGKTTAVSSWITGLGSASTVHWFNVSAAGGLPAIVEAVSSLSLVLPGTAATGLSATDEPTFSHHLTAGSDRCIVVLDDVPIGPTDQLIAGMRHLARRTGPAVRFVLLSPGTRAIDRRLLDATDGSASIPGHELVLDATEIRNALARGGVDTSPEVIEAVQATTFGWAYGVRLATTFLAREHSTEAAMREADDAQARYLETTVTGELTAAALDLLTMTSVAEDVSAGLAHEFAGWGGAEALPSVADDHGFVDVYEDGAFRCHPLLRRFLLRRLRRNPFRARQAATRASRWVADHGDVDAAIGIALDAGDWNWAAERLVESLTVPKLMLATDRRLERPEVADAVGAAEPLLLAGAALGRCWPEVAQRVVSDSGPGHEHSDSTVAERLSMALVRMAIAQTHADAAEGLKQAQVATELIPQLSLAQRAAVPELVALVQSHAGTFQLWSAHVDLARSAFARGARALQVGPAPKDQVATADCLGSLSWLGAIAGELTRAMRHAADVLTVRPADSAETGVVHAQLATVWSHLTRGELEQAAQRLDSVLTRLPLGADVETRPALAAAVDLTAARLAMITGDGWPGRGSCFWSRMPDYGWFGDQLRLVRAEAELDAGQPMRALHILRDAGRAEGLTYVIRARAWITLGDRAAVAASLRSRPVEASTPITQVQLELIEAWLARAQGNRDHHRALVDRALRTAGREQLRTAIAWAKPWLHQALLSDPLMLRQHGPFLASVRVAPLSARHDDPSSTERFAPLAGQLTRRELDILQRLGTLSTNEEIAADLFVSVNTVKTHMKSMFRKLDVTRRSEAFRRGRTLGLC
jgi:LuxR family transcriptional regulator, maltose regulon positive regulatory protein